MNLIYVLVFVLIAAGSFLYKFLFRGGETIEFINKETGGDLEESNISEDISESSVMEASDIGTRDVEVISIYLCGAVNSPGVYEVEVGTVLVDAIDLADGLSDDAAIDYLNLVYELDENVSIYIPRIDEISEESLASGQNSGVLRSDSNVFVWGGQLIQDSSYQGDNWQGESVQIESDSDSRININTASLSELMTLPGIGEVRAQAIIDYRNNTPFTSIEEIMNVAGIGESRFNAIQNLICV